MFICVHVTEYASLRLVYIDSCLDCERVIRIPTTDNENITNIVRHSSLKILYCDDCYVTRSLQTIGSKHNKDYSIPFYSVKCPENSCEEEDICIVKRDDVTECLRADCDNKKYDVVCGDNGLLYATQCHFQRDVKANGIVAVEKSACCKLKIL